MKDRETGTGTKTGTDMKSGQTVIEYLKTLDPDTYVDIAAVIDGGAPKNGKTAVSLSIVTPLSGYCTAEEILRVFDMIPGKDTGWGNAEDRHKEILTTAGNKYMKQLASARVTEVFETYDIFCNMEMKVLRIMHTGKNGKDNISFGTRDSMMKYLNLMLEMVRNSEGTGKERSE